MPQNKNMVPESACELPAFTFRLTFRFYDLECWRELRVPKTFTFEDFHTAIQACLSWLNTERKSMPELALEDGYRVSFEAHYRLVQIHPWEDGGGRMSRLLMNMIQYEAGLIPSIVKKETRASYIQSLADSAEVGESSRILEFMLKHHEDNLRQQIDEFRRSIQGDATGGQESLPRNFLDISEKVPSGCPAHVRKTYLASLRKPDATSKELSALLGVSDRTIRSHISDLKAVGLIERVGSDRCGYWQLLR